jgi:hypothetical protein
MSSALHPTTDVGLARAKGVTRIDGVGAYNPVSPIHCYGTHSQMRVPMWTGTGGLPQLGRGLLSISAGEFGFTTAVSVFGSWKNCRSDSKPSADECPRGATTEPMMIKCSRAFIWHRTMSQDSRGKAIEPGSLPIEDPCQHGRDRTGEAAAEDIGQIVSADKNT